MQNMILAEGGGALGYILIGLLVLALVAFVVWSTFNNRKRQKEYNATIDAIAPGNKVKTIGGIIGEVVEVNSEEGTFVIKTGQGDEHACYLKLDRQAIYQTDAKPASAQKAEEKPAEEEPFASADAPASDVQSAKDSAPAESEKPAAEEKPAEKPAQEKESAEGSAEQKK